MTRSRSPASQSTHMRSRPGSRPRSKRVRSGSPSRFSLVYDPEANLATRAEHKKVKSRMQNEGFSGRNLNEVMNDFMKIPPSSRPANTKGLKMHTDAGTGGVQLFHYYDTPGVRQAPLLVTPFEAMPTGNKTPQVQMRMPNGRVIQNIHKENVVRTNWVPEASQFTMPVPGNFTLLLPGRFGRGGWLHGVAPANKKVAQLARPFTLVLRP